MLRDWIKGWMIKGCIMLALIGALFLYNATIGKEDAAAYELKIRAHWNGCKTEGWGDIVCEVREIGSTKRGLKVATRALEQCIARNKSEELTKGEAIDCIELRRLVPILWPAVAR